MKPPLPARPPPLRTLSPCPPLPRPTPCRATGSGFIYDSSGFVLTNAHVVQGALDDTNTLAVTMMDGRVFRGRLLHMDK